jgi:hypothetical protein
VRVSDQRLRAAERAHASDPSAWRDLVAELRRAGRLAEARAAALRAWDAAKKRFDVLCPESDLPRSLTREERASRLAEMDTALADMDESLAIGRVLLHELHHEDGPGRCYCEASAMPHEKHLGRSRRRAS